MSNEQFQDDDKEESDTDINEFNLQMYQQEKRKIAIKEFNLSVAPVITNECRLIADIVNCVILDYYLPAYFPFFTIVTGFWNDVLGATKVCKSLLYTEKEMFDVVYYTPNCESTYLQNAVKLKNISDAHNVVIKSTGVDNSNNLLILHKMPILTGSEIHNAKIHDLSMLILEHGILTKYNALVDVIVFTHPRPQLSLNYRSVKANTSGIKAACYKNSAYSLSDISELESTYINFYDNPENENYLFILYKTPTLQSKSKNQNCAKFKLGFMKNELLEEYTMLCKR